MSEKTINQRIQEFVVEKRTALGMSQTDLAVAIFQDKKRQDFISKLESGKRDINLRTLGKILKALKADISIIEF